MSDYDPTKTSTGHQLSEGTYLDSHFQAMQPEYEAMIRSVGIQPGWRVLDAGCGGGSFLPHLAELVGETGHISAIDLAPENVAKVKTLIEEQPLGCPIEVEIGNLTALPYEDNQFDAIWCANITQYLTAEELDKMFAEFWRVVRPGGTVAIKEFDLTSFTFAPFDQRCIWRLHVGEPAHGALRSFQLPTWLKQCGFVEVDCNTFLSERSHPLRPMELTYFQAIFRGQAQIAMQSNISKQDKDAWLAVTDFKSPDHVLKHPDFYWRENHILVVGQVPDNQTKKVQSENG